MHFLLLFWKKQFDSVNKPGILLEVVQILTDLDFIITKAYISSDGGWFMDGIFVINSTIIPNALVHVYVFLNTPYLIQVSKLLTCSPNDWYTVFHVTDQRGKKITDSKTIDLIEKVYISSFSNIYMYLIYILVSRYVFYLTTIWKTQNHCWKF